MSREDIKDDKEYVYSQAFHGKYAYVNKKLFKTS